MCKSKSEGGKRCSFHLSQAVRGGVIAYAAALTGRSRAETDEAFNDLLAEGANAPAPTQAETNAFLEAEAFRVQHEPTLSDSKRMSIRGRLLAAVDKVLPDGATFHAWKNVVAESWARSRRRAAGVFLISTVAFGVGGCATAPSQAAPAAPSASATTVATAPAVTTTVASIGKVTYDKAAVAKFGQRDVEAAGKFSTEFVAKYGANDNLVRQPPGEVTAADFKTLKADMTPEAWTSLVESSAKLDTNDGRANTYGIALVGLDAGGYTVRRDVPGVSDVKVTKGKVGVQDGQMTVVQDHSVTLRFKGPDGKNYRMTSEKQVTFWLVKGTAKDRPFLIDGWSVTFGGTPVQPDAF